MSIILCSRNSANSPNITFYFYNFLIFIFPYLLLFFFIFSLIFLFIKTDSDVNNCQTSHG